MLFFFVYQYFYFKGATYNHSLGNEHNEIYEDIWKCAEHPEKMVVPVLGGSGSEVDESVARRQGWYISWKRKTWSTVCPGRLEGDTFEGRRWKSLASHHRLGETVGKREAVTGPLCVSQGPQGKGSFPGFSMARSLAAGTGWQVGASVKALSEESPEWDHPGRAQSDASQPLNPGTHP